MRETYDIVTSRAVANLKELIEYSIPLLKVNGHFVPMKSNIDKEALVKELLNKYQLVNYNENKIRIEVN